MSPAAELGRDTVIGFGSCNYREAKRLHAMRTLISLASATLLACRADVPPIGDTPSNQAQAV
jgi:hypothetical protein